MALNTSKKSVLNKFKGEGQKVQLGSLIQAQKGVVAATYDFAVSGGAQSTITIQSNAIPANAVITNVYADELTNVTSGGSATVAVVVGSTTITTAQAIAGFTGAIAMTLASSATAVKVAAGGDLKVLIATEALTAGKVRFFVEYMVSEDTVAQG